MESIIDSFKGKKVLIVGDVMVDAYIMGKVERMSPEAPVPVVNIEDRDSRLGGAANVALNIVALKAEPILCSVIGKDEEGSDFLKLLKTSNLITDGIVVSAERKTTTKTRILGNKHQLLRMDNEMTSDISDAENEALMTVFRKYIKTCDVVILEDYNKGVLTEKNIPLLIDIAKKEGKPVAVDPKKKNFLSYRHVTLFKPNLKEIKEGLNSDLNLKDHKNLEGVVKELHAILHNTYTMVTLSEDGVMITDHRDFDFIPAHVRHISDVSGAGDTVISVASLCLASNIDKRMIADLSNLAGGLVCEENGVVPIDIEKLKKESKYLSHSSH
jgi:rfaE bifunctional protein kinase chain/domain